jgi:hypothetical protein
VERFIIMLLATGVASGVVAAELLSEKELIGTWKIEPSTFKIRTFATPNSFPRPQLPTNYRAFSLILHDDKSFVATNASLFFRWPAMPEWSGTWWVTNRPLVSSRTNRGRMSSELYLLPPSTDRQTGRRIDSTIYWFSSSVFRSGMSTSSQPAFVLGPYKDETHTYEWTVLIQKQK